MSTASTSPDSAANAVPASTVPVVPTLEDLALFRDMAADDRHALNLAGKTQTVAAGELLIEDGGHHDSLFVVLGGQLEVTRDAEVLAEIGVGQICGEMEMLNPPYSTANVTAIDECVVWRLTRERMRQFMETHPKAGAALMKLMAQTFAARL